MPVNYIRVEAKMNTEGIRDENETEDKCQCFGLETRRQHGSIRAPLFLNHRAPRGYVFRYACSSVIACARPLSSAA